MPEDTAKPAPRVLVIADVESNAIALVERVLKPAGIAARPASSDGPPVDLLVVDVTQLRGDPLAGLREARSRGEEAPAIVLAAHFPHARMRDMFRLGVSDFLLKPYRPESLCQAVLELGESRSAEVNTQILTRRVETIREQVRRRSEEIRLLSEIGRVVINLDDLDAILGRVVEAAAFVTDAEEASIYLADPSTNELVLRANKQAGERNASIQRLRVQDTLVGEVLKSGQPIMRQPMQEDGPVKVQTDFWVQSLIKVPLRVRDRIVGVLGIYNRVAPRAFSEHHLTLLLALAHWAGVALEHAYLRQQATPDDSQRPQATAVAPGMLAGLDRALTTIEPLLQGVYGPLSDVQMDNIRALQAQLQSLRALPVATIGADEVQEMVDLPSLLHEVVAKLKRQADRRNLELVIDPGTPMPRFRGDSGRTRRVLETLTHAAIRRTAKGRVVIASQRLEVQGGKTTGAAFADEVELDDGLWAVVRISDTSSGLSPDTVRAITSPKVDPAAGHMGPGLSLGEVRMIVESMNGALWYEQTPASTTMVIALPIT
jgi:GAF domain-containing protein/AmiR/NasT family two-component response regulator